LEAHQKTEKKNATDDCSLVIEMGYDVFIVQGSEENIKITTDVDLALAESLLAKKQAAITSAEPLETLLKRFNPTI
jgi:2-C-methyl-D-erythritol 4-phosphate cytidylyltransferase